MRRDQQVNSTPCSFQRISSLIFLSTPLSSAFDDTGNFFAKTHRFEVSRDTLKISARSLGRLDGRNETRNREGGIKRESLGALDRARIISQLGTTPRRGTEETRKEENRKEKNREEEWEDSPVWIGGVGE